MCLSDGYFGQCAWEIISRIPRFQEIWVDVSLISSITHGSILNGQPEVYRSLYKVLRLAEKDDISWFLIFGKRPITETVQKLKFQSFSFKLFSKLHKWYKSWDWHAENCLWYTLITMGSNGGDSNIPPPLHKINWDMEVNNVTLKLVKHLIVLIPKK